MKEALISEPGEQVGGCLSDLPEWEVDGMEMKGLGLRGGAGVLEEFRSVGDV